MREIGRIEIPASNWGNPAVSLCWVGDQLVDLGGGIVRYELNGESKRRWGGFGKTFDRAISHGDYAITVESLGTKGIVLKGDDVLREINRSYYHADTHEYPVAIFTWFDGRTVIAHCPEKYNRLEIEEIESGKRILNRDTKSRDYFHSRFQVGPDGRHLVSAGWVWHPWVSVAVVDLAAAANQPDLLEEIEFITSDGEKSEETTSAAFIDAAKIVFSGNREEIKEYLGVYNLETKKVESEVEIDSAAGPLMPLGDHVVTFFDHPRLREIATGKLVQEWPDIDSGRQYSCILQGYHPPPLAMDPKNKRFAVGAADKITVVQFG